MTIHPIIPRDLFGSLPQNKKSLRMDALYLEESIKRRELTLNSLIAKVAMITDIPESDLLLERKNAEDKRLKDVLLLPDLLEEI
jgi:hypothetical protein